LRLLKSLYSEKYSSHCLLLEVFKQCLEFDIDYLEVFRQCLEVDMECFEVVIVRQLRGCLCSVGLEVVIQYLEVFIQCLEFDIERFRVVIVC